MAINSLQPTLLDIFYEYGIQWIMFGTLLFVLLYMLKPKRKGNQTSRKDRGRPSG